MVTFSKITHISIAMDSRLKTAIFVQKMIYRVEDSIAGTESFQIIYSLLWLLFILSA